MTSCDIRHTSRIASRPNRVHRRLPTLLVAGMVALATPWSSVAPMPARTCVVNLPALGGAAELLHRS
jgi:hypothetical protein